MDHIPLEIHMGLERKGELPDKMHCTSLSTKCWIMGWIFLPNPEGHAFILWVFSQTLWVLRFLGFENFVTCQGQLLHPWPMSPLCTKHMSMSSEEPVSGEWKEWMQGEEFWDYFFFLFSVFFSLFLQLFAFTLFIRHFFLILYLSFLHPYFFLTL